MDKIILCIGLVDYMSPILGFALMKKYTELYEIMEDDIYVQTYVLEHVVAQNDEKYVAVILSSCPTLGDNMLRILSFISNQLKYETLSEMSEKGIIDIVRRMFKGIKSIPDIDYTLTYSWTGDLKEVERYILLCKLVQ